MSEHSAERDARLRYVLDLINKGYFSDSNGNLRRESALSAVELAIGPVTVTPPG